MVYPTALAPRVLAFPVAFALALGAVGCGLPAKVVRDVTPAAVDSGLEAMDKPVNKAHLEHLAASPQLKGAERELLSGMIDGSLATLSDKERMARISALMATYTTAMSRDLGPALQNVLVDNLGPGLAATLENQDVRRALGDTAHLLGREMVLGVNEGILKAQQDAKATGEPSAIGSLGKMASKTASIASGITWVLAALVVVLGGLLVKLLMQARKFRSESKEKDAEARVFSASSRHLQSTSGAS
jgi:hypothetical protein